jgi:hypothetical protein
VPIFPVKPHLNFHPFFTGGFTGHYLNCFKYWDKGDKHGSGAKPGCRNTRYSGLIYVGGSHLRRTLKESVFNLERLFIEDLVNCALFIKLNLL